MKGLEKNERILVEAIRQSPVVEIVIHGYDGVTGDCRIKIRSKKVCHDIALAVQSHYVNQKKMGGGTPIRNNIIKH